MEHFFENSVQNHIILLFGFENQINGLENLLQISTNSKINQKSSQNHSFFTLQAHFQIKTLQHGTNE